MRKITQLGLIIANTALALALGVPIASADNLSDAQAELRKDTRQMYEARRAAIERASRTSGARSAKIAPKSHAIGPRKSQQPSLVASPRAVAVALYTTTTDLESLLGRRLSRGADFPS